jgi:hypothetical protein
MRPMLLSFYKDESVAPGDICKHLIDITFPVGNLPLTLQAISISRHMAAPDAVSDSDTTHQLQDAFISDIEKTDVDAHLQNTTIKNFGWQDVTVTVKDHKTKQPKALLHGVSGIVQAGLSSSYNARMGVSNMIQVNCVL